MTNKRRWLRLKLLLGFVVVIVTGLLIPESPVIPVEGATATDWNPKTFWYEPWGKSGVHKGIDIFAPQGRVVKSAVPGIVIFRGTLGIGGNVVAMLGPKWRIHYYAHLTDISAPRIVNSGTVQTSEDVQQNQYA
jgi:peptidoglycan LD-endopeptidase LytH